MVRTLCNKFMHDTLAVQFGLKLGLLEFCYGFECNHVIINYFTTTSQTLHDHLFSMCCG